MCCGAEASLKNLIVIAFICVKKKKKNNQNHFCFRGEVVFAVRFSLYLMDQHTQSDRRCHFICLNLESRLGTTCLYVKL